MLTLLATLLIVGGTSSIGWQAAAYLSRRPRELRQLITLLEMLETEVDYGATPLPEALERLARRLDEPAAGLLRRVRAGLRNGEGWTAGEAWQAALAATYPRTAWRREDLEILWDLGYTLGNTGREDQLRHLRLGARRLAEAEREALRAWRQSERMYRYLGVLSGLALALVAW